MTTRRTFLQHTAVLSAAALIKPDRLFAGQVTHHPGLQLYSLRDQLPKDVKGVMKKVADAGYTEVETYGYTKNGGYWGLDPKMFSDLLNSYGLTTPSGHYGMDLLFAEDNMDDLKTYIDAAKITGQTYVTVPYINEKFRKTASDMKSLVEKINKAAEVCKLAGLKLAYHNHNFEFQSVENTTLYDLILRETNPSLVKLQLDLYWAVRAKQDPAVIFNNNPGRFVMVHVKDMDKAQPELNTEIGNGSIDYKTIIAAAKKANIEHYIMEQENYKIDPYTSITRSCEYMKNTLML